MPRMVVAGDDNDRHTQLLRGVLDMCMLALLAREPAHGYELVRRMETAGFGPVSYGTIYPLLTRMRRLGLVADEEQASPTGPPRKIYALTEAVIYDNAQPAGQSVGTFTGVTFIVRGGLIAERWIAPDGTMTCCTGSMAVLS